MMLKRLRRGSTLLELMVTLPTATVLVGSMAMCIALMMRAKTQDETLFRDAYDLSDAANRIASDLESALSIASSSATHIEFVVPDRNADGTPETMRYEWGGTSGDHPYQLLWTYNSEPQSVLFDDIDEFSLQLNSMTSPSSVPNHLRGEVANVKMMDAFLDCIFCEEPINATNHVGQYFVASIPGVGRRWDLGALRIMLRSAGSSNDGVLRIRVTEANSTTRLPTNTVLAEVDVEEWRLGSRYQWLNIPLAPIAWQTQSTPLCITLSYVSGSGTIAYVHCLQNGTGMPSDSNLVKSNNGGASWTSSGSTVGMRFYALGTYDGFTGQRRFLNSVDLKLKSTRPSAGRVETTISIPSGPEML